MFRFPTNLTIFDFGFSIACLAQNAKKHKEGNMSVPTDLSIKNRNHHSQIGDSFTGNEPAAHSTVTALHQNAMNQIESHTPSPRRQAKYKNWDAPQRTYPKEDQIESNISFPKNRPHPKVIKYESMPWGLCQGNVIEAPMLTYDSKTKTITRNW